MLRVRVAATAVLAISLGVEPASARAGILSIRFAGGANEITLTPSQSATIEVTLTYVPGVDKAATKCTRIDSRFDVGGLADAGFGDYVVDGPSPLTVTSVVPQWSGWTTLATTGVGGAFNNDLFLSVGDPAGVNYAHLGNNPMPILLASFSVRLDSPIVSDLYVVFHVDQSVPVAFNDSTPWNRVWGTSSPTPDGNNELDLGRGNPGKGDPGFAGDPYPGNEMLQPLIIQTIPEPSGFSMLAGLVFLKHRR